MKGDQSNNQQECQRWRRAKSFIFTLSTTEVSHDYRSRLSWCVKLQVRSFSQVMLYQFEILL